MEGERTTPSVGSSPLTEDRRASSSANSNERVTASIENWKRKLLDLTKRNRALNFKMSKVSTIAIVDERPAEVFRQLYLRERSMRFKAAPEPDEQLSLIENNVPLTRHTSETVVDQRAGHQGPNLSQNSTSHSNGIQRLTLRRMKMKALPSTSHLMTHRRSRNGRQTTGFRLARGLRRSTNHFVVWTNASVRGSLSMRALSRSIISARIRLRSKASAG